MINNKIEIYHKDQSQKVLNFENDTIKTLQNLHQAVFEKDKELCDLKQALKVLEICDEVRKKMAEILCTICARGGSKGVKNKNIRKINELEMIAYSIIQAQKFKAF